MPGDHLTRFKWERRVVSNTGPGSPTTRLVLLTLATHADRSLSAFPSIKTLSAETQLSERAVVEHVQVAVDAGWLHRASAKGEGKAWRRSVYRLTLPSGADPTASPSRIEGAYPPASPARDSNPMHRGGIPEIPVMVPVTVPDFSANEKLGADPDAVGADPDAQGADPDDSMVLTESQSNNVQSTSIEQKESIKTVRGPCRAGKNLFVDSSSTPEQATKPGGLAEWGRANGFTAGADESQENYRRRLTQAWIKASTEKVAGAA